MEIRDPIHGPIKLYTNEVPIIQDMFFQRLRNIKQLGLSEYAFPGATHTRYLHSLGVMHLSERIFNKLFHFISNKSDFYRLKHTLRLSCLLHDIGHAPLSHSTESAMPQLKELQLPPSYTGQNGLRKATHEDYTVKAIIDGPLTEKFQLGTTDLGVTPERVADLIYGQTSDPAYFTVAGVNYFSILHQIVSSEMDCDRMDYLLRDSYFCGVSYGQFDLNWLIDNLQVAINESDQANLGISHKAVSTFDDFLIARFHMFLMVYYHHRAVCLEQLLLKFFESSKQEYFIPASIEKYQDHDDHFLYKVLRESKNPYAQQIIRNEIPDKILEVYDYESPLALEKMQEFLDQNNIPYFLTSSSNRLSKYYGHEKTTDSDSIMVIKTAAMTHRKQAIPIHQATDLYEKYKKTHSLTRVYCSLSQATPAQKKSMREIIEGPYL